MPCCLQEDAFNSPISVLEYYWSAQQIHDVSSIMRQQFWGSVFLGTHTSLAWQDEKGTWEISKWKKTWKRCFFSLRYCFGQSFSPCLWLILLPVQEMSKEKGLVFTSTFPWGIYDKQMKTSAAWQTYRETKTFPVPNFLETEKIIIYII